MAVVSSASTEVLVQHLINVCKEEYSLTRGLDGAAQQLKRTLGMIQAYLKDAEKKSITQDSVRSWLKELESVAFEADNVLDEHCYHLHHKTVHNMKSFKDKVLSCFSSFYVILHRRNMAHAIKQINAEFGSMNKTALDLGLQSMVVNAPAHTSIETDSFSLDPVFIGRDYDVSILVDMLTLTHRQERMLSILALVGMGGMGKTTLARKLFNHEKLKARFGSTTIWIHVSQTFDAISLFNKILDKLHKKSSDGVESGDDIVENSQEALWARVGSRYDIPGKIQEAPKARVESRENILEKLQKALKTKTYLLVLDDVWNDDVSKWEDFINSILGVTSTSGNVIIITTRSQRVASIVNPFHIHHLDGLSDEDCWSIIKAKTFVENGKVPSGLEMIGRKIAKRCQGLPLAANVIGAVLRGKSEDEWHSINEKWLSDDEGGENIKNILKLSYDYLSSPSLKKCFVYCSVFPKGYEIEKQELIEQWMAEGFLQPSQRDDMESVGNMFINVLVQNSLLQVVERDEYGNVWTCVMHALVHDLASYVLSNNGSTPTRYMFLQEELIAIPNETAKHLRTLIMDCETSGMKFSDFGRLHNLILPNGCKELPNSIRELMHLRNLDISYTEIAKLPKWIHKLHHLETLRACQELEKLPSTLKYMLNLRHLHIHSDTKLPAEIGRLTNLQTLPHFIVGKKKGYQIEELGSLKNLKGTLMIRNLEKVLDKEEALKANMFQKPNLLDLEFAWDDGIEDERNDESVLEGLQPHAYLKKLKILGFKGKRFPTWVKKMAVYNGPHGSSVPLDNLIDIRLSGCSEIEEIPTLEHLSNLKSLRLKKLKNVRYQNAVC
ncbi:putative disease resistance protein RGA3 [Salvia hispanica]|uniref:putative disease resistance protein RGA3 n=1 Tax=Salvia hispanica TaxID=49212 RepID=UPI00200927CE|nr:putative disease resistance protein RGA3 [Salvia hispanica]